MPTILPVLMGRECLPTYHWEATLPVCHCLLLPFYLFWEEEAHFWEYLCLYIALIYMLP